MRRFLLAWEFGGDLGHLRRQCAIARALGVRGHEVLLAFSSASGVDARMLQGARWVQAPKLRPPASPEAAPINASDILLNVGFADPAALSGALAGWSGLMRAFAPSAVVGDHAPTALLAARLHSIPRVALGAGFSLFPRGDPMPALRPWAPGDPRTLADRDARLVCAIHQALRRTRAGETLPSCAREVFEAEAYLACTWPELDCFGPREDVEYVGPQGAAGELARVDWNGSDAPRIFAYLKPRDARFSAVMEAIAAVAGESLVAVPGIDAAHATQLSRAAMRVLPHAVDLESALARADLCVGHGGAGLVAAAASMGVPMALLPMQLEQSLIANRVRELGSAVVLAPGEAPASLGAWLREASANASLRAAAQAARERLARPPLDPATRIEAIA